MKCHNYELRKIIANSLDVYTYLSVKKSYKLHICTHQSPSIIIMENYACGLSTIKKTDTYIGSV